MVLQMWGNFLKYLSHIEIYLPQMLRILLLNWYISITGIENKPFVFRAVWQKCFWATLRAQLSQGHRGLLVSLPLWWPHQGPHGGRNACNIVKAQLCMWNILANFTHLLASLEQPPPHFSLGRGCAYSVWFLEQALTGRKDFCDEHTHRLRLHQTHSGTNFTSVNRHYLPGWQLHVANLSKKNLKNWLTISCAAWK